MQFIVSLKAGVRSNRLFFVTNFYNKRHNSDLLSKIYLNYTFYLFRMNINYVFFYTANPINTSILKIN